MKARFFDRPHPTLIGSDSVCSRQASSRLGYRCPTSALASPRRSQASQRRSRSMWGMGGLALSPAGLALAASLFASACDDRSEAMQRQVDLARTHKEKQEIPDHSIPEHPLRAKLLPLLSKLYALQPVPPVTETGSPKEGSSYELEPGVAAVVKLGPGLSDEQKIRAIITGVAEADAWAYRPNARRTYADLIHRVKSGFGEQQRDLIMAQYAQLHLLDFFNSPTAQAVIDGLDADVKATVSAIQKEYVENKAKVWAEWMGIKMYARRIVAGEEPFLSVLRQLKKELGQEEPPPLTWEESMDGPFVTWAKQIRDEEELLIKLTDMPELKDREQYLNETHTQWLMEGSPRIPESAKGTPVDKDLGFAVAQTDLGGGFNEITFIFPKKLSGAALKKAFIRSIIYADLLSDFKMLATAGSDFAERDANNVIDSKTSVVPDKYVPLYARCASNAAVDRLVRHFGNTYPVLAGLPPGGDDAKSLESAHKCIVNGAAGDVYVPSKGDDKDVEGPAPGSHLALSQMLIRFEGLDVDLAAMASDKRTEEDDVIDDAEAVLKRLKDAKKAE